MSVHPWVSESRQGPVRFGIQAICGQDAGVYARAVETGKLAESLGFDFYSIFDHPLMQADPFILLSAVATVTERIRLGSTVMCGLYRHPTQLARLAADLDGISGGRAILGLGSGWMEREFAAMEVPFGTSKERQDGLDEAIEIILGSWGDEPFSYTGKRFSTTGFQVLPPPVQQPRPPIMIGGSGEKRTLRQVAKYADACNIQEGIPARDGYFEIGERVEAVKRKLAALDGHCDDLGRPRDEVLRTHFTLSLILGETEEAARAKYDAFDPNLSASPGTRANGKGGILTASVDRAVEYYQAMVDAGVEYFLVQLEARDTETIELLGRDVMPSVRR
jgi:alkanesulfonate monooxygenase SsuD/methylene tetrahydromethanopterin reductase-like flavin-dependent oxidoreductase (luciferase family)